MEYFKPNYDSKCIGLFVDKRTIGFGRGMIGIVEREEALAHYNLQPLSKLEKELNKERADGGSADIPPYGGPYGRGKGPGGGRGNLDEFIRETLYDAYPNDISRVEELISVYYEEAVNMELYGWDRAHYIIEGVKKSMEESDSSYKSTDENGKEESGLEGGTESKASVEKTEETSENLDYDPSGETDSEDDGD